MATERRSGYFGGTGTATAALDVIGAADTGWSDYEIWGITFLPFDDCTITINEVDAITIAANVAVSFSKDEKIKSLKVTENGTDYQLMCYVHGLYTS